MLTVASRALINLEIEKPTALASGSFIELDKKMSKPCLRDLAFSQAVIPGPLKEFSAEAVSATSRRSWGFMVSQGSGRWANRYARLRALF